MVGVRFYGDLKRFGERFDLDVRDAAEAIRALCYQIPNLRQHIQKGLYKVRIGKNYLSPEALEEGLFYCLKKGQCIHVTPVLKGAKSGGVFQAVLGVALITASFFIPHAGLLSGLITSSMAFGVGTAMLLGGVAQMLTKTPSMDTKLSDTEKKQSTSFSSLSNMTAQGRPVPLAYGRILTGSLVISQGVETYNVEEEIKKTTNSAADAINGVFKKG
ncbi:tail assembly protein [Pasteurellaceae bacterium USgator11]|nr:tail assembly protein [Pasteurellaceae bacterium USgator41]TNG95760.1 tail assembly protein [Pasteurellaceae bacterium UScroc12]TNG98818.1 tail assembly protein [Pasteurellaceae bacterium USgator11]TNG99203.1 tail assembly protein [Pasteurellaceae bacterium UScroc31]